MDASVGGWALARSVIAAACDDDRDAASVELEPAASETAGGDEAPAVAVAASSEAGKSKEAPPAVVDAPADGSAAIEPVEESVPSPAPRVNVLSGSAEYAEGVDYFPEKVSVAHAENFGVEYFVNYKVVTVPEPTPGGSAETLRIGAARDAGASANGIADGGSGDRGASRVDICGLNNPLALPGESGRSRPADGVASAG